MKEDRELKARRGVLRTRRNKVALVSRALSRRKCLVGWRAIAESYSHGWSRFPQTLQEGKSFFRCSAALQSGEIMQRSWWSGHKAVDGTRRLGRQSMAWRVATSSLAFAPWTLFVGPAERHSEAILMWVSVCSARQGGASPRPGRNIGGGTRSPPPTFLPSSLAVPRTFYGDFISNFLPFTTCFYHDTTNIESFGRAQERHGQHGTNSMAQSSGSQAAN